MNIGKQRFMELVDISHNTFTEGVNHLIELNIMARTKSGKNSVYLMNPFIFMRMRLGLLLHLVLLLLCPFVIPSCFLNGFANFSVGVRSATFWQVSMVLRQSVLIITLLSSV